MKNSFLLTVFIALLLVSSFTLFSQSPPHPNNGNPPSAGNGPVGNGPTGAPLDGGTVILFTLGSFYAGRKIIKQYRSTELP